MHTSYFGNIKKLPSGKAIAICQGIPNWFHGKRYPALAPSWAMIKLKEAAEYERQYAAQLSGLDPQKVYDSLEWMVNGDAILLCWEKPGEPCHRRLVALWLEKALGIEVPEYERLQPELL